jgi:hypothetical protein
MIDDFTLKQMNDLMRTLESPGVKETLRAAEKLHNALSAAGKLSTARDILEQQKLMNSYLEAAKVSQQMSNAILSLGSAAHTISGSIFGSAAMSAIEAMANVQVHRHEEIAAAVAKISADQVAQLTEAAQRVDWHRQITTISTVKGFDLASFQSRFGSISRIAEAAESSMRLVQWKNIAALDIAPLLKNSLELRTAQLNRSFDALTEVMARQPEFIVAAPPFVAKTPPLAVYSHAEALRSISAPPEEEEEKTSPEEKIWTDARDETFSTIDDLLPRISPELMTSWKGGWKTAGRRTEDWVRQAAASFRHVLATTLDTVAPRDRVKAEVNPKYLEKDEVVRKTQAVWLCEPLKNKTYRKVILADIESAISIIDVFSEAVHRSQYQELEEAFNRMAVRVSVALRHILELHFNRMKY